MELIQEEILNKSKNDSHLSTLLNNTQGDKFELLQNYREKMTEEKKAELSLSAQNNEVLTAIQNLVDSSNKVQNTLSLEIEKVLVSELNASQQESEKQKELITRLQQELLQKQESEKYYQESLEKLKEEHKTELIKLSSSHQKELTALTNKEKSSTFSEDPVFLKEGKFTGSAQMYEETSNDEDELEVSNAAELYQKKLREEAELSKAADVYQQESTEGGVEQGLYYKLIGWPDFNRLTKGNRIIPLASRLMAQQMSLKQIEHFLGGPTEKERASTLLDELSSLGLLTSSATKEEQNTINNKPEKSNRLQLFKRIRSSLGI